MLPSPFQVYADQSGLISRLPTRLSKKIELANWAATLFETGTQYTEKEVNEIIGQFILDYALIRRMLVNSGQLVRDRYGKQYVKPITEQTPAQV